MAESSFNDIFARLYQVTQVRNDAALAVALGVTAQSISQAKKKKQIPPAWLIDVATRYSISTDWLLFGKVLQPLSPQQSRRIQIRGLAACSVSGWYNPSQLALSIAVPLTEFGSEAFAVVAVGLSMQPAGIRPGNILFCDPASHAEKDDLVYVERSDGTASIKRLVHMDKGWVHIQGWLDPDAGGQQKAFTETIAWENIKKITCVVLVKIKA